MNSLGALLCNDTIALVRVRKNVFRIGPPFYYKERQNRGFGSERKVCCQKQFSIDTTVASELGCRRSRMLLIGAPARVTPFVAPLLPAFPSQAINGAVY